MVRRRERREGGKQGISLVRLNESCDTFLEPTLMYMYEWAFMWDPVCGVGEHVSIMSEISTKDEVNS